MKDDSLGRRVWLVAALPVGIVAALVVSFWPEHKATPKRTREEPTVPTTTAPALPPPEIVWAEPRPPAPPSPSASSSASAPASAAPSADAAVETEKIPELQAFRNNLPADADEWTPEQRQAYRDRLFARLEARERALEREVAFAESRGDPEAAALKKATLAHLRASKARLDRKAP